MIRPSYRRKDIVHVNSIRKTGSSSNITTDVLGCYYIGKGVFLNEGKKEKEKGKIGNKRMNGSLKDHLVPEQSSGLAPMRPLADGGIAACAILLVEDLVEVRWYI